PRRVRGQAQGAVEERLHRGRARRSAERLSRRGIEVQTHRSQRLSRDGSAATTGLPLTGGTADLGVDRGDRLRELSPVALGHDPLACLRAEAGAKVRILEQRLELCGERGGAALLVQKT